MTSFDELCRLIGAMKQPPTNSLEALLLKVRRVEANPSEYELAKQLFRPDSTPDLFQPVQIDLLVFDMTAGTIRLYNADNKFIGVVLRAPDGSSYLVESRSQNFHQDRSYP